jgi:hypothetical protein
MRKLKLCKSGYCAKLPIHQAKSLKERLLGQYYYIMLRLGNVAAHFSALEKKAND